MLYALRPPVLPSGSIQENSRLFPYLKSASLDLWRCPSDHSTRTFAGSKYPRTRSSSMNVGLGYY